MAPSKLTNRKCKYEPGAYPSKNKFHALKTHNVNNNKLLIKIYYCH